MTIESELTGGIRNMVRCMVNEGLVEEVGRLVDWTPLKEYLKNERKK